MPTQWVEIQPANLNFSGFSKRAFNADKPPMLAPIIPRFLLSSFIINLSSRLGSIDLRGETQLGGAIAYQCSKAALNMLTKQAAIDLKPLKIRVISQSPGWVKTEMGGVKAKYQVSEAVSMMLHSLNQLPSDQTGVFIGEDGKEIPW